MVAYMAGKTVIVTLVFTRVEELFNAFIRRVEKKEPTLTLDALTVRGQSKRVTLGVSGGQSAVGDLERRGSVGTLAFNSLGMKSFVRTT